MRPKAERARISISSISEQSGRPRRAVVPDDAPATGFAITLGEKRFLARADETLLEAATRQTIVIPCGCASGMCGTCRVSARRRRGRDAAQWRALGRGRGRGLHPRLLVTAALAM
jgi:ferredoxin